VANFLTLVKQGFYNGSPFHRVLPEFMPKAEPRLTKAQAVLGTRSNANVTGRITASFSRHDEHGARRPRHGQLAVFLTFVPTPHLNGMHTAFGRVIDGMEVLGDLQRRRPSISRCAKADRILKAEIIAIGVTSTSRQAERITARTAAG